jgi:Tat protein secretion system quality control protein TatD with DNase activity
MSKKYHNVYITIGMDPGRRPENSFGSFEKTFNEIEGYIKDDIKQIHRKIIAIGECGLDFKDMRND